MVLEYKKCKQEDLQKLATVSKKTFCEAFEKDNDPEDFNLYISKAFAVEQISGELKNPNTIFYFAYNEEILVAYFKLNEKDAQTDLMLSDSMELERIYVLSEFQGKRIGERLLEKIKTIALDANKSFLWLGVWENNVKAIQFYQRNGFVKFGTHPYYIGKDKQTDWLMRCDLTNLQD